jgi:hypothetical protein
MNEDKLISEAMRVLGKRTSAKKARSSRRNGKLGGRKKALRKSKPNG